jgi:hypothetical protein
MAYFQLCFFSQNDFLHLLPNTLAEVCLKIFPTFSTTSFTSLILTSWNKSISSNLFTMFCISLFLLTVIHISYSKPWFDMKFREKRQFSIDVKENTVILKTKLIRLIWKRQVNFIKLSWTKVIVNIKTKLQILLEKSQGLIQKVFGKY